jgi:hypothetical protein
MVDAFDTALRLFLRHSAPLSRLRKEALKRQKTHDVALETLAQLKREGTPQRTDIVQLTRCFSSINTTPRCP